MFASHIVDKIEKVFMPTKTSHRKLAPQEELVKDEIGSRIEDAKFCIHCGSYISDARLRKWHTENEHPRDSGGRIQDGHFCLICGDNIGTKMATRNEHYRKTHR